jgi:hypothetical protein
MKIAQTLATSVAILLVVAGPDALGADHGDTPTLGGVARHDLNITDLHVFTTDNHDRRLVIAISTNDAIPNVTQVTNPDGSVGYRGNVAYQFPSDLQIRVLIDAHSHVSFANSSDLATYGGTIVDPAHVGADIELTITFDANGAPSITGDGFADPGHGVGDVALYAGLRDDPFIHAPRLGRNVGSVVLDMPLHLVWAATQSLSELAAPHANPNQIADRGGRAFRSMFDTCLNGSLLPSLDGPICGGVPDVVIFDTTRPARFPNGRLLTDDVSAYLAALDPRGPVATKVVATDGSPRATTNDAPFSSTFPYLVPPHDPGCYCTGAAGPSVCPSVCKGLQSYPLSGYQGCFLPDTGRSIRAAASNPGVHEGSGS